MYERFYNLRERPFALSPDPDYLYPSKVHKEALSYLRYGIEGHAGFIVITGEIGSGKTTLLQTALRGLDQRTSVSRIVNTMLDARELIEAVMLDFGLETGQGRSKPHLLRDLARFLVEQRNAGRLALLVIDEAQNLSLAALEEVRMLSNLETEKSKLIQVALIGQPNLRDLMGRPELEQLRQRVTVSYHLKALSSEDTFLYINHRLRRAALGAPPEFSRDVTDLIHLHSQGVPRKINVIADAVLLFGYGEEQHAITVDLAHQVIDELETTGVIGSSAATAGNQVPSPATIPDPEIAARELRLQQRERQIAEQQRILMEELRIARLRQNSAATVAVSSGAATWPPAPPAPPGPPAPAGPPGPSVTPGPSGAYGPSGPSASPAVPRSSATPAPAPQRTIRYVQVPAPSPHPAPPRPETLWTRLRGFFSASPIFED